MHLRSVARSGIAALLIITAGSSVRALGAPLPEAIDVIPRGGASASQLAQRLDPPDPPPTTPPPGGGTGGRFTTLPPGSPLPSDAACAAAVRPAPEVRPINAPFNQRIGNIAPGSPGPVVGQPITGNYTGTTDEIIQWAACKWGIDEDIVRAQIVKETYWHQNRANSSGDKSSNPNDCAPALRTPLPCPDSIGLGQVRYTAHGPAFINDNVINSSAYNLDYTYSVWRACFEGQLTWLNQFERGGTYAAGDVWGCTGVWFSGRWRTPAALGYIADVQEILAERTWTTGPFLNFASG